MNKQAQFAVIVDAVIDANVAGIKLDIPALIAKVGDTDMLAEIVTAASMVPTGENMLLNSEFIYSIECIAEENDIDSECLYEIFGDLELN